MIHAIPVKYVIQFEDETKVEYCKSVIQWVHCSNGHKIVRYCSQIHYNAFAKHTTF